MNLNAPYVLSALQRLAAVYTAPTEDFQSLVGVWGDVLHSLTADQIRAAVDSYLKSDARFWPKPGQILALGREYASGHATLDGSLNSRYLRWENSGYRENGVSVPCPACGVAPETDSAKRLSVVHHRPAHFEKNVMVVGRWYCDCPAPIPVEQGAYVGKCNRCLCEIAVGSPTPGLEVA